MIQQTLSIAILIVITIYFFLFTISSYREHKPRAVLLSSIQAIFLSLLLISLLVLDIQETYLLIFNSLFVIIAFLFFFPFSKPSKMIKFPSDEKVDERDSMFAREELKPGTNRYKEYYEKHPELKEIDDKLREYPELLSEGGHYYQPDASKEIKTIFGQIKELTTKVDGHVADKKQGVDLQNISEEIKNKILSLGASEVGIALLDPRFIYSHVGRGPELYGQKIELNHSHVIVYTLEMDYNAVEEAPDIPITREAAKQYLKGAKISVEIARYIRSLGYPARAHISDSNYQIMLPPVAQDAGLGELSRMGYLISKKYGPRVRLGAVTTDLPLTPGKAEPFGVQDFCKICLKCADNCPSAAIPSGDKTIVRGVEKWQLDVEQCIKYWRIAGTDCGLCMKVCPYSHPPTFVHNVIRTGVNNSAVARKLSIWGDDFFYGRKIHYKI